MQAADTKGFPELIHTLEYQIYKRAVLWGFEYRYPLEIRLQPSLIDGERPTYMATIS
jgi:hypothetical protein